MMSERIWSFPPVAAESVRLLILGTMPSAASLDAGFYYAHPRNCFWPMMAEILGESNPADIDAKRALLMRHGIALWDVAMSCVRPGSLDSNIREPVPNDIGALLRAHPGITCVLLNGGTAMKLFERLLPDVAREIDHRQMPSTSPAYTLNYALKRDAWAMGIQKSKGGKIDV